MPDSGHFSSAVTSASCASSSARPTSRTIRASPAISRADSIRQTALIARWVSESGAKDWILLREAVFHRIADELSDRAHAHLLEDARAVARHRLDAQTQLLGDVRDAIAGHDEREHLELA